jgi:predicted nuclease of predicted toxin-antitoxin system
MQRNYMKKTQHITINIEINDAPVFAYSNNDDSVLITKDIVLIREISHIMQCALSYLQEFSQNLIE